MRSALTGGIFGGSSTVRSRDARICRTTRRAERQFGGRPRHEMAIVRYGRGALDQGTRCTQIEQLLHAFREPVSLEINPWV